MLGLKYSQLELASFAELKFTGHFQYVRLSCFSFYDYGRECDKTAPLRKFRKEIENAGHRLKENICEKFIGQRICILNISRNAYNSKIRYSHLKNGYLTKEYIKMTNTWNDAENHWLLGSCELKA